MNGVYFISFAKVKGEPERLQKWVNACGRQAFTVHRVTKDTYICSKHFVGGAGPTTEHPDPVPAYYCKFQVISVFYKIL
jgi:THAP domain